MARSFRYTVSGKVQGVSFRYFAKRNAELLGVVGWVKNSRDGTVIGIAEGEDAAIRKFQEALNRGPPSAVVDKVEISEEVERGQCQYASEPYSASIIMFRASPWNHYKPSGQEQYPNVTQDHHNGEMDEDVDMEAPQISILQEDKTPPPPSSAALRTSKFRVKLLVNDKKGGPSQPSREDEQEEDEEEDELIDDDEDDELKSTTSAQAVTSQVSRGGVASKRGARSKGRGTGAGTTKRKTTKSIAAESGPVMTWFEVSGPDAESGKQGQPADTWESASVASVNTPSATATKKKPTPKGGARGVRKPVVKQLKVSTFTQRDEGDNISEAAYTAASSPIIRETTPDLESIAPPGMVAPSASMMAAEESLEGVALPIYPLPSKPFPVLPPQKIGSGFAPIMALDKSGKKVRHWRQTNREIRGIAGGRWFARSWAGAKDSEYATAVAAGLANAPESEKANGTSTPKPTNASTSVKGGSKGKPPKTDTAPSSRSSSIVPELPPNRTTSGPSKMRTSHVAPPDGEEPQLPAPE